MQNQLGHPPISQPLAGVEEREAWVRLALGQRAQAPSPPEQERLCKTLKRLQPAAATAPSLADLPDAARKQALEPLRFLQTLRGLAR